MKQFDYYFWGNEISQKGQALPILSTAPVNNEEFVNTDTRIHIISDTKCKNIKKK